MELKGPPYFSVREQVRGLNASDLLVSHAPADTRLQWREVSGLFDSAVVVAPDQPVDGDPAGDRTQPWDEGQEHQQKGEQHHQAPDLRVGIVRGREGLHLVPERVEPHPGPVSYTHLRAHETDSYLVCRLLLEKKKRK